MIYFCYVENSFDAETAPLRTGMASAIYKIQNLQTIFRHTLVPSKAPRQFKSLRNSDFCHSRESGNPNPEFREILRTGFPLSRE
jgi:hypothetical protein